MERALMNESAEHASSLIELHEHLTSSHFSGSFGTIENPILKSAILNERVVGCGAGTGDAENVPQQGRILGQVLRVRSDLRVGLRHVWGCSAMR